MVWQTVVVIAVVAVAALYVSRRAWRMWTGRSGGGCHCSAANCAKNALPPADPSMPPEEH